LWKELTEWHREIYQDPRIGGEHPENYFDEHLKKVGPEQIWVAESNLHVVGFIGLVIKEGEAEIEPLIVSKTFRGRGIGAKLVEAVLSEVRKRGFRFLNVSPVARNVEAMRFFHKQGFKSVGHVQLFMSFTDYKWKSGLKVHDLEFEY
jgi:ribosomal protein S18 acetylase RimI-like enzyme